MKTKWITPRTEIETFIPNEYIAVCWAVGCSTGLANDYELKNGPWWSDQTWAQLGCSHDPAHCGTASNQWIVDSDNNGIPEGMTEMGTDLGNLGCRFYSDATYRREIDISSIRSNSTIYWTTSAADGRVWHHQGFLQDTYPGRPNAS